MPPTTPGANDFVLRIFPSTPFPKSYVARAATGSFFAKSLVFSTALASALGSFGVGGGAKPLSTLFLDRVMVGFCFLGFLVSISRDIYKN